MEGEVKVSARIWTNNRDFAGLGVEVYTMTQLASLADANIARG
jgi:hypothetical protein